MKRRASLERSSLLLVPTILVFLLVFSSLYVLVTENAPFSVWNKLGNSAGCGYPSHQAQEVSSPLLHRDDPTCLSRSQQYLYRNPNHINFIPSPLLQAWASYTHNHKSCFHHNWTELFLNRDRVSMDSNGECRFLVYVEGGEGLGNCLLSLVSAFAFAMATGRVLLIDSRKNIATLLCEPFPESSWVLPTNFPYTELASSPSVGPFMRNRLNVSCVSLNLQHNILAQDQQIFCEDTFTSLKSIKWVAWTSNQYFLTNFFLVPSFWERIHPVFQGSVGNVFTYLSRLLLLPANDTWAFILREFWSYLADATSRLGVQVRLHGRPNLAHFDPEANGNISECLLRNGLLPSFTESINLTDLSILHSRKMEASEKGADVVVLLASLQGKYAQVMKDLFAKLPTKGTKMVRVHSVSQLGSQNKGFDQAQLAFVEMWLLSFSDDLATSEYSTFGYIAQGLGDLHPYILALKKGGSLASPCVLGQSVEPCTHYPKVPRCLGADAKLSVEHKQWIRTHLRHCQDHVLGWQLVPSHAAADNTVFFDFL